MLLERQQLLHVLIVHLVQPIQMLQDPLHVQPVLLVMGVFNYHHVP